MFLLFINDLQDYVVIYSSSTCRWLRIIQKDRIWSGLETATGRYEQVTQMEIWLANGVSSSKCQLLRVTNKRISHKLWHTWAYIGISRLG